MFQLLQRLTAGELFRIGERRTVNFSGIAAVGDIIVVGCTNRGHFRSVDGGATWSEIPLV